MRRCAAGTAALVLIALVPACGRKITAPPPAPTPTPPGIEAIFPAPRSTRVPYDTEVWVEFERALDPASANERTVFFKDETRRIPAIVSWSAETRRLHVAPQEALALQQTYTVELAGALSFVDGTRLGEVYRWQFTTTSLRRLESPTPRDRQTHESPFTALGWGGITEREAGTVSYEVYAADDSAAVAAGTPTPLATLTGPPYVPRVRWAQDRPTYWAVGAHNLTTGERRTGPVWRFETFPVGAPYDSFPAPIRDWDWVESSLIIRQRCNDDTLTMGPGINCTIRWNLGPPDTAVRLAGAAIDLTPRYASHVAATGPSVWSSNSPWEACIQIPEGPPFAADRLADAQVLNPTRIRFASDALSAHVEASRRLGGLHGYLFQAPGRRAFFGPNAGSAAVRAVLWLYVYRPPPPAGPAPLAARAPGRYARGVPRR